MYHFDWIKRHAERTVEITRLRSEKELVNLRTTCTTAAGTIVCSGESLVLVRDLEQTNE